MIQQIGSYSLQKIDFFLQFLKARFEHLFDIADGLVLYVSYARVIFVCWVLKKKKFMPNATAFDLPFVDCVSLSWID